MPFIFFPFTGKPISEHAQANAAAIFWNVHQMAAVLFVIVLLATAIFGVWRFLRAKQDFGHCTAWIFLRSNAQATQKMAVANIALLLCYLFSGFVLSVGF